MGREGGWQHSNKGQRSRNRSNRLSGGQVLLCDRVADGGAPHGDCRSLVRVPGEGHGGLVVAVLGDG